MSSFLYSKEYTNLIMNMEKGKQLTIDELGVMFRSSFEYLVDRFDSKIDSLEAKMDKGFAAVNLRFDRLEGKIGGHENRITHLEDDMRILKTEAEKKIGL